MGGVSDEEAFWCAGAALGAALRETLGDGRGVGEWVKVWFVVLLDEVYVMCGIELYGE